MALFNNTFKAAALFAAITLALYGTSPMWAIGQQTGAGQSGVYRGGQTALAREGVKGYSEAAIGMLRAKSGGGSSL